MPVAQYLMHWRAAQRRMKVFRLMGCQLAGKVQAAGAIVGQVMKATRGQADAGRARELILEKLGVEG